MQYFEFYDECYQKDSQQTKHRPSDSYLCIDPSVHFIYKLLDQLLFVMVAWNQKLRVSVTPQL